MALLCGNYEHAAGNCQAIPAHGRRNRGHHTRESAISLRLTRDQEGGPRTLRRGDEVAVRQSAIRSHACGDDVGTSRVVRNCPGTRGCRCGRGQPSPISSSVLSFASAIAARPARRIFPFGRGDASAIGPASLPSRTTCGKEAEGMPNLASTLATIGGDGCPADPLVRRRQSRSTLRPVSKSVKEPPMMFPCRGD